MYEWYGCKSCSKYGRCIIRHDPAKQKIMKATNNCNDRDYKNNVRMRSTFR